MESPPSLLTFALSKIRLLALDVDGVLTDGCLHYGPQGEQLKCFHVLDGHGITMLIQAGIPVAIISGRNSSMVQKRSQELGIIDCFQGIHDKMRILVQLCQKYGVTPEQVAYMGDDTPDISVLRCVGVSACPKNAHPDVQKVCHWRMSLGGGAGSVRALCDAILKQKLEL